jgi:hypothetical protein
MRAKFWLGSLARGDLSDDLGVGIFGKSCLGVMDRIHLTRDRCRWRAHVNTVMNLRLP